jgi:ATP-dependent RNA helicase SUPV3L1/SUV3
LFENNGVIKRELVDQIIKKIPKEERANLRKAGIKIGRYHVFLPKMLKPNAVDLRVKLWKLYFPKDQQYTIPKSGLNFFKNEVNKDKKILLICGFENFDHFYVRVDILERLFLKIIENSKSGIIKINSDMINLLGSSRENFYKLLHLMQYTRKVINNNKEDYFIYKPKNKKNIKEKIIGKSNKNSPFDKLAEIRFR